jgi:cytochrome c
LAAPCCACTEPQKADTGGGDKSGGAAAQFVVMKDGAMFQTMTIVKTLGALCAAALVFLLGYQLATGLFLPSPGPVEQRQWSYLGWVLEEQGGVVTAEPEVELTFEVAFAQADVGDGERQFRKCQACHKLEEGANATGPYLHNIVGRPIATAEDFSYSAAMLAHQGEVWTPETMAAYLGEPNTFTPGNAMGNAQAVRDLQDRADLIAYLQQAAGG